MPRPFNPVAQQNVQAPEVAAPNVAVPAAIGQYAPNIQPGGFVHDHYDVMPEHAPAPNWLRDDVNALIDSYKPSSPPLEFFSDVELAALRVNIIIGLLHSNWNIRDLDEAIDIAKTIEAKYVMQPKGHTSG